MRKFLASCFGVMAAFIFLFIAFIAILVFIVQSRDTPTIDDNTVLQINMRATVQEQTSDDSFNNFFASDDQKVQNLYKLKNTIESARDDDKIKGIHLDLDGFHGGMVIIEELRNYLLDFRESKKWVIAHATHMSPGAYYLSTVADKIYLNPEGEVAFNGLSVYVMFYKKMLDKLKIKTEVFRVGAYKSAVEPFIRENLSEESRAQLESLLQSIEQNMLKRIAKARNIPEKQLKGLSDSAKIQTAHDALIYGLIDDTRYADEIESGLKKRLNVTEDDDLNMVSYDAYHKTLSSDNENSFADHIAVVVVEGTIIEGESNAENQSAGATSIVEAIDKANKDDDIKAIIVRINSPGGSFIASDKIWHAIKRAAAQKTVVASMSNYAASGGYYIAAACNSIVAQPNTITGSIGVFGLNFDASEFLEDKLGITGEEVKTGQLSNVLLVAPMSDQAKAIWQSRTDSVYETFIKRVVSSRKKMTAEQVRNVAGGRVWTGTQARENGLVDVLGNYEDAIELAAKKAGIEDYTVQHYNKPKSVLDKFMKKIIDAKAIAIVQPDAVHALRQQWQHINSMRGIQARMPFERIETAPTPVVQP